jgi:ubiquitin-protein ligase
VLVERVVSPRWRASASLGVLGNELLLRHLKNAHLVVRAPPGLTKPYAGMATRVTGEVRKMIADTNPSIAIWGCDIRFVDDERLSATAHVAMMTGNGSLVRLVFDYPETYPFDQPAIRILGWGGGPPPLRHPCIADGKLQPFDANDWSPICDTSGLVITIQEMLNDTACVSIASISQALDSKLLLPRGESQWAKDIGSELVRMVEERISGGAARALVASAEKEPLLLFTGLSC